MTKANKDVIEDQPISKHIRARRVHERKRVRPSNLSDLSINSLPFAYNSNLNSTLNPVTE
jgi:hypothetical protein